MASPARTIAGSSGQCAATHINLTGKRANVRVCGPAPTCLQPYANVQRRELFRLCCAAAGQGGRHPELLELVEQVGNHTAAEATNDYARYPLEELHKEYRRTDYSEVLAWQARRAFAENVARGEAGIRLAEAALQIAAEDDAVATNSTVAFPIEAYLQRIHKMASEVARGRLHEAATASTSGRGDTPTGHHGAVSHAVALQAVHNYLYKDVGFQMCKSGRSNMPKRAILDHPGTWEDFRQGYLHEALVRRVGHPAALAIIHAEVLQQLLLMGAIDFAVTMDCRSFTELPTAVALPNMTRNMVLQPDGSVLNTTTSEALVELLRHLKRAYWPFPWDTNVDDVDKGGKGSHGGYRGAAKAALGDEMSANLRAIASVASHRLDRGIWTTPGAGDLRRCIAASERLVMLLGDDEPEERRDLGVLLLHAGRPERALAELTAYSQTAAARQAEPFDARFTAKLLELLRGIEGLVPAQEITTAETALNTEPPSTSDRDRRPLTW